MGPDVRETEPTNPRQEDIEYLEAFRGLIDEYLFLGCAPSEARFPSRRENPVLRKEMEKALQTDEFLKLRRDINEMIPRAKSLLDECGTNLTMFQYPAPAVGGPVLHWNLLDLLVNNQTAYAIEKSEFTDVIDRAIGVLKSGTKDKKLEVERPDVIVAGGFVFIAMPMDPDVPALEDVHSAIKEVAAGNGLVAERVDDPEKSERITDRILESLETAEHVVVDLTSSKPNVYYEAGYAHALGKIPIYIASEGTSIEFDLKDYPVIFFKNISELKRNLDKRFKSLMDKD